MNVEVSNKMQPLTTDEDFKEWLKGVLRTSTVMVQFTKKDGTTRDMICTLDESLIPKVYKDEEAKVINWSEEVQRVYDVEADDWRSFRWDSITLLKFDI